MADNLTLNSGSGGSSLRTDDDGTAHWQYVKLVFGADNTQTIVGSISSNPLPVALSAVDNAVLDVIAGDTTSLDGKAPNLGTAAMVASSPVTIASDDTLTAAANALLTTIAGDTTSLDGKVTACNTGAVSVSALSSVVDANNSSATPLGIGAAFPGAATDTLNYSHVTVSVFADQASATNGLMIQWSSDGTNWDNDDTFTIPASTGKVFSFGPVARYMRVAYTNGGVGQGAFRLETILRIGQMSASSHRISDSISGEDDAELVKAVVTGLAPDTTFRNLLVTNAGEMKISLENVNGVVVPVSQSGTWNIGTVTTVSAVTAITNALPAGDNNIGNVDIVSGTVTTVSTVTNLAQLGGQAIAMGTGARSAGTQRVTIATDDVVPVTGTFFQSTQPISDVTVATLGTTTYSEGTTKGPVVGAVRNDDLATLANTDNEAAPLQVDAEGAMYVNPAAAEPKRDSGVAAGGAPGTDDIVAAVASRKIRVLALGLFATSTTANNVFLDNADNDLLFNTGNPLPLAIDADGDNVAGFVLPYNPGGWFETDTVNEAVTLNSSAAQDIAWTITYIEVP